MAAGKIEVRFVKDHTVQNASGTRYEEGQVVAFAEASANHFIRRGVAVLVDEEGAPSHLLAAQQEAEAVAKQKAAQAATNHVDRRIAASNDRVDQAVVQRNANSDAEADAAKHAEAEAAETAAAKKPAAGGKAHKK